MFMHWFLIILAAVTLLLYVIAGLEITIGARRFHNLDKIAPIADHNAPRVSVIVPACNEERNVEVAMRSLVAQDYPDFEVIAVNDRSTDSTGSILDRLAKT